MKPSQLTDGLMQRFGRLYRWMADPLAAVLATLYLIVLIRNAWISEDAYITLRTVDNFVHGYGLRWNTIERVQAYTHPLWMFVISFFYWFTREAFYTVIFLCLAISTLTVWLVCAKLARSKMQAILCAVILILSKAFVDYSTSGLENPLTHLLLAVFCLLYFQWLQTESSRNSDDGSHPLPDTHTVPQTRTIFGITCIAALGTLNRMDTIIIYLPALLYLFWRIVRHSESTKQRWRAIAMMLFGFTPFIAWECFSLLYYGFLFPNTAYAKLNTGIHPDRLIEQGINFFENSLRLDPLTLTVITGSAFYALIRVKKNPGGTLMALGVLAYLVYILRIGGDYMSGRLFSAPLVVSALLLAQAPLHSRIHTAPLIGLAFIIGLSNPISPIYSGPNDVCKAVSNNGISDERRYYNADLSLLGVRHPRDDYFAQKGMTLRDQRERLIVDGTLGLLGYYAGPNLHIIDPLALTDPLLARLPTIYNQWRIGHFIRELPRGYQDCALGGNTIQDPSLADYWDALSLVTRGDLWSLARLHAIWNFTTGRYDRYIDEYCMRSYLIIRHNDPMIFNPGSEENGDTFIVYLNEYGIGLYFPPGSIHGTSFAATLSPGKTYEFLYYRQGQTIARQTIEAPPSETDDLVQTTGTLSEHALQQGFDMLRIVPGGTRSAYKVGTFQIVPQ